MREIRIPVTSIAVVVGLALIGNGVDGSTGAGIALVVSVILGFLAALVTGRRPSATARRKTLRHTWFMLLDECHVWRADRERERAARKRAETAYLRRRREARVRPGDR